MNEADVQTLFQRFVYQPWNSGDLGALDEVVADDYRLNDEGSLDDLKQAIKELRSGFPDLRVSVDDIVVQGDRVAYRWTMTGTHQGRSRGWRQRGEPSPSPG